MGTETERHQKTVVWVVTDQVGGAPMMAGELGLMSGGGDDGRESVRGAVCMMEFGARWLAERGCSESM
jgi:hypothetical protein